MTTNREAAGVAGKPIPAEEAWAHDMDAQNIQALKAQLAEEGAATPNELDVLSHSAEMRKAGLDVDGEGHGAPRGIQPRPAAQPIGRVNEDGSSITRG